MDFITVGNLQVAFRLLVIEALHAVDDESAQRALQREITPGGTRVECMRDARLIVVLECRARNHHLQYRGVFCPRLIELHQQIEKERPVVRVAVCVEKSPRLPVITGRRPFRRLEQTQQFLVGDGLARKRARRPTVEKKLVDSMLGLPYFACVHFYSCHYCSLLVEGVPPRTAYAQRVDISNRAARLVNLAAPRLWHFPAASGRRTTDISTAPTNCSETARSIPPGCRVRRKGELRHCPARAAPQWPPGLRRKTVSRSACCGQPIPH